MDASKFGIGVVLMQQEQPIAFFSTTLKGKNVLLSTYEKELDTMKFHIMIPHVYMSYLGFI